MTDTERADAIRSILGGYTEDELFAAFDAVADPYDWRAPIDSYVDPADVNRIVFAIKHYTATVPTLTVHQLKGVQLIRVRSIGYRMGPAGS